MTIVQQTNACGIPGIQPLGIQRGENAIRNLRNRNLLDGGSNGSSRFHGIGDGMLFIINMSAIDHAHLRNGVHHGELRVEPRADCRSRPGAQAVEHHRHFGVDLCEILDPFTRNELVAVVRVTGLTDQVMALRSANNLGFGQWLDAVMAVIQACDLLPERSLRGLQWASRPAAAHACPLSKTVLASAAVSAVSLRAAFCSAAASSASSSLIGLM